MLLLNYRRCRCWYVKEDELRALYAQRNGEAGRRDLASVAAHWVCTRTTQAPPRFWRLELLPHCPRISLCCAVVPLHLPAATICAVTIWASVLIAFSTISLAPTFLLLLLLPFFLCAPSHAISLAVCQHQVLKGGSSAAASRELSAAKAVAANGEGGSRGMKKKKKLKSKGSKGGEDVSNRGYGSLR